MRNKGYISAGLIGLGLLVWSVAGTSGCGGTTESGMRRPPSQPIDFVFEMDGEPHRFAELRGRPVLLVLIRTSELTSQMYIREVVKAHRELSEGVLFLVLSIEAHDAPFIEMYSEFEELPFSIGLAEPAVAVGESSLGRIPLVPTTYLIGRNGKIVEMAAGTVPASALIQSAENL